ncbi:MAG: hypothetical protein IJ418_23070 [Clostridia bacterium]|nr:hypothetical protein [Clostridia bacterium]
MKATTKLALTMMIALVLMATTALAATLLFSPRYDALQLADQALLEKYGITEEMQPALHHNITEADGAVIVTYELVEGIVMRENRFGVYTVTVRDGKAEAAWSMDGMDTAGGLEAPAWGSEQLLMYVQNYARVGSYMESHGMLQNAPMVTPAPADIPDKWEHDKQTALSMAQITLVDAAAIGREAVTARYGLTEQQAAMLVRFDGSDPDGYSDESTYEIVEGRPMVNLFFHLTQKPGEWVEKDGIYVVTINLLDGAVEDIYYDTGLMGNG